MRRPPGVRVRARRWEGFRVNNRCKNSIPDLWLKVRCESRRCGASVTQASQGVRPGLGTGRRPLGVKVRVG